MVKNCYEISPALGIFQGVLLALLIIPSLYIPGPDLEVPSNLILIFIANLANASSIYYVNWFLKNIQNAVAAVMEILPLPAEPISETVKEATLQCAKKAQRSHLFFKTPDDAQFIPAEERTFMQKTASFFGGGSRNSLNEHPREQAPVVPLAIDFQLA